MRGGSEREEPVSRLPPSQTNISSCYWWLVGAETKLWVNNKNSWLSWFPNFVAVLSNMSPDSNWGLSMSIKWRGKQHPTSLIPLGGSKNYSSWVGGFKEEYVVVHLPSSAVDDLLQTEWLPECLSEPRSQKPYFFVFCEKCQKSGTGD